MASKLIAVFVLLVICQVCLSARVPRGSPTKTEAKPADSSSESEESLDKMAEDLQKGLNKKDADEVKKIVNDIQTAKDPEQTVDSYVKLVELGIKALANQFEADNTTTSVTPTPLNKISIKLDGVND